MKTSNDNPTWFRPTSDVGFHKIFCTEGNDELVLQLLNAVIDDKIIVSFKRLDTKHQINIDTDATFDLYCTCDDDSRVIVECQRQRCKGIQKQGPGLFRNGDSRPGAQSMAL